MFKNSTLIFTGARFLGVLEAHMSTTADFFRNRLDQIINLHHPLAVLAHRMPWQKIEASLAHLFARQVRAGKEVEDSDLFGATEVMAGAGVSKAGRPCLPTRLRVAPVLPQTRIAMRAGSNHPMHSSQNAFCPAHPTSRAVRGCPLAPAPESASVSTSPCSKWA